MTDEEFEHLIFGPDDYYFHQRTTEDEIADSMFAFTLSVFLTCAATVDNGGIYRYHETSFHDD